MASNIDTPHIPKTMKGVVVEKTGGPDVLQYRTDLPVPEPKEGELLIKNDWIGVNYIDTYFRTGLYPSSFPLILGKEASGHVVSLGPTPSHFSLNDHVVWMGGSSYAEYSTCNISKIQKIPSGISSTDACAAFLQGLTALTLVEEAYKVEEGDWVLVLAASGGVGGLLCQVLKAKGAKTIATVGRKEKVKVAEESGADVVVVEGDEDVLEIVKGKTGGEGVKAVFDGVGKDTFDRSLESLARKGTLVSFGNSSGAVEPFSLLRLTAKNAKIIRPSMPNYVVTQEEWDDYSQKLFQLMHEGKVKVRIHDTYPLQNVAKAHTDLESRITVGKLLLKP